ncbi:Uncharacterised protein [BD1-7 clade bacterium]|uniref:Cytochrome c-552/4 domain-containing protein n=1 Tax=BD1-7 clade bacterium TaxID=2029982 RepID=A0A5S9PH93_9GAMM|nr:Uncharacterised protein [BD1-7 clade bacterium]
MIVMKRWQKLMVGLTLPLLVISCGQQSSGNDDVNTAPTPPSTSPSTPPVDETDTVTLVTAPFDKHWNVEGAFSPAASCGDCHSASNDEYATFRLPKEPSGEDISPYSGWQHSVVANAYNDPIFRAKMEDEVSHLPSFAGTIEDKCLTCHTPMARHNAHTTNTLSTENCMDENGCYRSAQADESMMAREGVSCTFCHQLEEDTDKKFSGFAKINDDGVIYGPWSNPAGQAMQNHTQYQPVGSKHLQQSETCATCHNLKTPAFDVRDDTPTGGEFVEQAPYTEWLNSEYSQAGQVQSCQDCHMKTLEGYESRIATMPGGAANSNWPVRTDYSQHTFVGGNNYLLELLRDNRAALGIETSTTVSGFDRQIAANTAFVDTSASLQVDSVELEDDVLSIDVTVVNRTGHKLPTGFPSRRLWVALSVSDGDGRVLFESGVPDAKGWIAQDYEYTRDECVISDPSKIQAIECISPHYDVIRSADEVPVYEAVMGDTLSNVTYVLLYGDHYLKDNRIPPRGFSDQHTDYEEIAVVGQAAADPNFNRSGDTQGTGADKLHYRLAWDDDDENEGERESEREIESAENLTIDVVLYYQVLRPTFAAALKSNGERSRFFRSLYDDKKPEAMVLSRQQVNYQYDD